MRTGFVDEIKAALKESGLPANQLEIEITESILIESVDKAVECIKQISDLGVRIAVDDFGTGYSSLSYLNSFPADLIKVDRSFIITMNSSETSKQFVAAIIALGHVMNYKVIAEGVENQEQLDTLNQIGCDLIQGFVWGRPMDPEEAAKLIK
jgi:EAL domain-containing protein (putative c-di-GMP-specific phosphodiesterase class I)